MIKRISLIGISAILTSACLFADFSYEQSSKVTGGMMAGAMRMAGVFSKQAREPIHTSVFVKGDRMATIMKDNAHIVDLAKETITDINFQKKQYSVITFAQMAEALKDLGSKIKSNEGEQTDITFKASVKQTGQTREISGQQTHETILTIEMEGTDKKTGKRGVFMVVTSNMWLAPNIAGYDEVKQFGQRMAQRLNWMPGSGGPFAQGAPGASQGMAEMYKEMSKLDGVPVLQVVKMGFKAEGQEGQQAAAEQPPQPQQQQAEAEKPSSGGALGRLGRLGGLGGLGRRRREPEQQQQAQEAPPGGGQPGTLMEMTTETTSFSTSAVDASKFEVPAGFKQVENEMVKQMRK